MSELIKAQCVVCNKVHEVEVGLESKAMLGITCGHKVHESLIALVCMDKEGDHNEPR